MASKFAQKFGKELFAISPEAMAALESFPWPGNIRQLENVVQQAVLVSSGPELLPEHLPPAVQECAASRPVAVNGHGNSNANGNGQHGPDSLEHNRELLGVAGLSSLRTPSPAGQAGRGRRRGAGPRL